MPLTSLSVELEKRVGDNNYGSERSQVTLHFTLDSDDEPTAVLQVLQQLARGRVEHDLAESKDLHIRRALIRKTRTCSRCSQELPDEENSYMHQACREAEDAEREARYQALRAERDAQERQQDELVGVAGPSAEEDDLPL